MLDGFFSGATAVLRDGVVLQTPGADELRERTATYHLFPGNVPLVAPAGAAPGAAPFAVNAMQLAWRSADGRALLAQDGTEIIRVEDDVVLRGVIPLLPATGPNRFVVGLSAATGYLSPPQPPYFAGWALYNSVGGAGMKPPSSFTASAALSYIEDGDASRGGPVAGNAYIARPYAFLPALLDLQTSTVHLIRDPFEQEPYKGGRNFVDGLMRGPFVRVVSPGDCVNVRAAPGNNAPVLNCAAHDVLLVDIGGTSEADGQTWRLLRTPQGDEGWAAAQFLER